MRDWLRALHDELRERGQPVVRVVVATVRGSAPREAGASMLVTPDGQRGTIGGGHLEFVAIAIARDLLTASAPAPRVDRFSLGASLGQCCGGIVELWFQRYDRIDLPFLARALAGRECGEAEVIEGGRLHTRDTAIHEGARGLDTLAAVLLPGPSGPRFYESIRS
ncbi:MAG: XdhC family protein, partial [Usitatibacter sp.]